MSKTVEIIILVLVVLLGAFLLWAFSRGEQVELPSGETRVEEIVIDDTASVPSNEVEADEMIVEKVKRGGAGSTKGKEIFVTDGVRHSVPLDEILDGGPPKDGIPSIDRPSFVTTEEAAEYVSEEEPGIAFSLNGIDRFYPIHILVWHEIVNDTFPSANSEQGDGQRVLVTYCPLCLSGIVFDPVVDGERVEFGTSGKLWQSNLVMYDRKSDSLWSQILGEAILGDQTGKKLAVLPSDMMRFGDWKARHSSGEVLSRNTGATRFYGRDPYGDYYTNDGTYFPIRAQDGRLSDKDFVFGIVVDGKAKAYWVDAVRREGEVVDTFAGKTIVVRHDSATDTVRIFEIIEGEEVRINPFPNFWFSWVAAHPDTELYM